MTICPCCDRETEKTVMGVCWACANAEAVILDGFDMDEQPIEEFPPYSQSMARLKYILHNHPKMSERDVQRNDPSAGSKSDPISGVGR